MRYFALQVTCEACHHAFLVGGASANDLDIWRDAELECSQCGATCRAANGDVVGLTSRGRGVDHGTLVGDVAAQAEHRGSQPWLAASALRWTEYSRT